jgi:hypothetical protein
MMEFSRNDFLHYIDPTSLHGALVYGIIFIGLALFATRLVRISTKRSRKFFPDTSEPPKSLLSFAMLGLLQAKHVLHPITFPSLFMNPTALKSAPMSIPVTNVVLFIL